MGLQKLRDGRYRVFVDLGRTADGKRQRHTEVIRGTRKEAERREREVLRQRETGTYVEPNTITVEAFMIRWLGATRDKVEERTWERYEQIVRNQIVPTLGHMRLSDLRPLHIEAAESEWLRTGNRKTKEPSPLSPRSVLHAHRCLHTAMERAIRWKLLPPGCNPMDGVEPPHVPHTEAEALSPEEARRLIEVLRGREYELPILVGMFCGLRPTEYLGLRWQDIDLERQELRVRQNVHRVRSDRVTTHMGVKVQGFRFGPTKTHRSRRPVSIPEQLAAVLKLWRAAQAAERLRLGEAWMDLDLVFTDAVGQPHTIQRVEAAFDKALKDAGIRDVRLYDLRHTMATLMLYLGESLKLVAARLGHSSETLVLTTYGHMLPGMDREATRRLSELLADGTRMAHEREGEEAG